MGTFYVTTAIPYVNAEPHLGFALELVQADVLARYHRLIGDDAFFLTGTDENSLTNVLAAERESLAVRSLVDRNAELFRSLTGTLGISNDDFIRTASDRRHLEGATCFWQACERAGDLYRRAYQGLYCVRCECFYTAEELHDGRCPEHEIVPETVEEENYFFRLSRYTAQLAELLESRVVEIVPAFRHAEIQAFVVRGLTDFSISRTAARARGWGIPVPGDPGQVMYVWFDALTNYVTALGYATDAACYRRYWTDASRRVHVIGKDILRFHAVYWPAMLLSAGVPLPTTIRVHGFLTRDGRRMSKTLGTGVNPVALVREWGVDAVRYWLLHDVPPTDDADYTDESFARSYVADLANDLGNLLNRTVSMIHRYRGAVVPLASRRGSSALVTAATALPATLHRALGDVWDPRLALDAIFAVITCGNRAVDETKPWALARAEGDGDVDATLRLDTLLHDLVESLRLVAEALRPLLPDTAERMATQLGVGLATRWTQGLEWSDTATLTRVGEPLPLFPKRRGAR